MWLIVDDTTRKLLHNNRRTDEVVRACVRSRTHRKLLHSVRRNKREKKKRNRNENNDKTNGRTKERDRASAHGIRECGVYGTYILLLQHSANKHVVRAEYYLQRSPFQIFISTRCLYCYCFLYFSSLSFVSLTLALHGSRYPLFSTHRSAVGHTNNQF